MRAKRQNRVSEVNDLNNRQLTSKRLLLRPLDISDFMQWSEVRTTNRDWLVVWEPTRDPRNQDPSTHLGSFKNRCVIWERESELGKGYQFGIFLPVDSEGSESGSRSGNGSESGNRAKKEKFIGEINMTAIYRGVSQSCSLGYWIDESHAGNSYMPESVVALCKFAFDVLNLHRVQISIVPRNKSSLRVVEKLGFRKEGLSERYLEINGTWEDHYIFAITSEEWLERKDELCAKWLSEDAAGL